MPHAGGLAPNPAYTKLYWATIRAIPVRLKTCSGPCGQRYPITHFWSDAGAADGRMSRCPTCEKNARRTNAEARAAGELDGAVETVNGRVVHFSEEERKRRSELAKRLHAQGRFGGKIAGAGGAAVKRHRIADAVVDHFRKPDMQELVLRAFESNLRGKNKTARRQAANDVLRIEREQDDRLRADRGGALDPSSLPDDELLELVAQGIEAMIAGGQVPADIVLDESNVQDVE
jgi:hypothetical protein